VAAPPGPGDDSESAGFQISEADLKRELKEIQEADAEDADEREHLNIIFLGHVDAGKSTIAGHLLFLTGQVDKRTIEKYEREARENNRGTWFYAYIMDTIEEERAKGKTVEVGRAHFETKLKRYTILDAPGHKNFVPNMIAGLAQADIGVLIISAKTGEFESGFDKAGQTREHATLAKTLGMKLLVIAVNKMDEVAWSKERYDDICTRVGAFLRSVGWSKEQVLSLPISGYTGLGLVTKIGDACSWYSGPSLVGLLDELKPVERNDTAPLRMPVVDKFKDMGFTYVMGKVEAGSVSKGQNIMLMPNRQIAKVQGIYHREDDEMKKAKAGESIRIALAGVEETDVLTGFVLCDPISPVKVAQEFTAQLAVLELPASNPLFTSGYESVIHIHTCVKECIISDLIAELDKKTKQPGKKKPTFVRSGGIVIAKITLSSPICAELFDVYPQLGRFTLRDKGRTIAIGKLIGMTEIQVK
jgi:peptide chain release factor subunit 3